MKQFLISIIVPVYNVEKELHACINSIVSQTYTAWELILINDGSKDNSGKICDQYAQKDSRIRVIHQTNHGVSYTRKVGFEASTGEWICFIDSDDTIEKDYIQTMMMNNNGVNIVHLHMPVNKDITPDEYLSLLLKNNTYNGPVYKLFHRSLISSECFSFPTYITHGEDTLMNISIALKNKKNVRCVNYKGYHYYMLSTGLASSHKSSMNYEEKYYQILEALFTPLQKEKYLKDLVTKRYWRLYELVDYRHQKIDRQSSFWTHLLNDTKKSNLKLEPYQWCIYYLKNDILLKYAFKIIRKLKLIKKENIKL